MPAISLALIDPNPDQPRKHFDPATLQELAASIRMNGLIFPIKLRPRGERYEIIAGERRWRAHKLMNAETIEAIVEAMDNRQRDLEAIIENLQREDVTPIEEARAYKRLIDEGMDEAELAAKLGIRQPWRIKERLVLLNLDEQFMPLFESGNISAADAYEIALLDNPADQGKIVQMMRRGKLKGTTEIRAAVRAMVAGLSQTDIFGESPKATENELDTVSAMERKVDAAVRVVAAGFHENEIVIARKVAPDRARLMAEKLALLRKHCLDMENALRRAAAQHTMLAE